MMDLYIELGVTHILDWGGYDHLLFLVALVVPFTFADWRKVLFYVSIFTLGHSISLYLGVLGAFPSSVLPYVEQLIPITIVLTCLTHLFGNRLAYLGGFRWVLLSTFLFGLLHGMAFAGDLSMILRKKDDILIPMLKFALGIELGQVLVVCVVLFLSYMTYSLFRQYQYVWRTVLLVITLLLAVLLTFGIRVF